MPSDLSSDRSGPVILVVEDTLLLAEVIAEELADAGFRVVGPVGRLQAALRLAAEEVLDGAFLDVNLAGEYSFPVADVLSERNIPFVFLTGYADGTPFSQHDDVPRIAKPFAPNALVEAASGFRKQQG